MYIFVHAQGIKTVKKWQNSVHVVVECPLSKTYNAPMKKQRERTSTFCVLRQIVPLIPFVFCLCFTHSVCSYQALIEIITSFYCICFLCTYLVGLHRTSRPVRKSGKFSKSGLSENRTLSLPGVVLTGHWTFNALKNRRKKKKLKKQD